MAGTPPTSATASKNANSCSVVSSTFCSPEQSRGQPGPPRRLVHGGRVLLERPRLRREPEPGDHRGTGPIGLLESAARSDAMSITKRYFTSLLQQPLVGLVDLLDADQLDVGRDPVLGAEVEHLLRLADAADGRAGEAPPLEQQVERRRRQRLLRRADERQRAVALRAATR